MFYVWLALALGTLLLEIGHPGLLFFLSFSFGSFGALLVTMYTSSIPVQISVFIGIFLLSLMLLRRFVSSEQHKSVHTNMFAIQGKVGVVIKLITPHAAGQVKIEGEVWSARSVDACQISVKTLIRVVRVVGAHVIVQSV